MYCLYLVVLCSDIGLCTSWSLLYPMRSFDPLRVYHALRIFLSHCALCPYGVFMSCGDSYSWSLFYSKESLVPHVIFYGPCGSAVSRRIFNTFVHSWTLCATQGVLYSWNLFPCEASCEPTGSVVPLLFRQTETVMSELYMQAYSQVYPLHSDILGSITPSEHFTARIDNVRTGPHAHV